MKLYRYMSTAEFQKMSAGCPITGHHFSKMNTSSDGVCFFGEVVKTYGYDHNYEYNPSQAWAFLFGIVSADVLVEFDVADTSEVCESWGVYADPYGLWDDCIEAVEYCVPSYSRDTFVPTRYCVGDGSGIWEFGKIWYEFRG